MAFSTLTFAIDKKWLGLALPFIGITLATTGSSYAADQPSPGKSERCLPIKDIRRTEVIDDQNILFHVRNNKVYNNRLPHRCSGLMQSKTFKYETSQSELCNVDIITVLLTAGGGYMSGASCSLGLFEPAEVKPAEVKKDAKD